MGSFVFLPLEVTICFDWRVQDHGGALNRLRFRPKTLGYGVENSRPQSLEAGLGRVPAPPLNDAASILKL